MLDAGSAPLRRHPLLQRSGMGDVEPYTARLMFRRLKEFLTGKAITVSFVENKKYMPSNEGFTFESLWDDYERRTWHYDYAKATLGASNPRLLNWIGSVDQSGYTREKCLQMLIATLEPGDENRILLRLADWVPQVQGLAREWVLAHFRSLSIETIRKNQRLILYLSRKDRLRNDASMREIKRDLLARARTMTSTEFFGLMPMFRRFLFSLSLADEGHLRALILDDPEPFNRLLLLNEFEFSDITDDEKRRLRADKFVSVRRRLFHVQLESGISPTRDEVIALAVDPNRSLRELGQFWLNKNFEEDAYAIYRGLDGDKFFYLADYARVGDAEHFLEGVRFGSRLTQYNCLRALASAAPDRLHELEISALIAQSRKFRSVLLPLLPRLLSIEEILALRSTFEESSPNGTISFLRVLEKKSFWTFVDEGLAVLLSDPEFAVRQVIAHSIQSKATICEPLSSRLRESINAKIAKLREHDPKRNEAIAVLIEFIIKAA